MRVLCVCGVGVGDEDPDHAGESWWNTLGSSIGSSIGVYHNEA